MQKKIADHSRYFYDSASAAGGGCGRVKWSTLRWKPVISDHVTTWRHIAQPLAPNLRRQDVLDALMRYALQCRTERRRTQLNESVLLKRLLHNRCECTGPGACVRCCIGAGQTLRVHSSGGSTLFHEMTSWVLMASILKVWRQIENPAP